MASTSSEGALWVPGAVVPLEPVSSRWAGTTTIRWVAHANGKVGEPSHDVELGAMHGPARVLVVAGSRVAYPALGDQRQRATQLLTSLPGLQHRSPRELRSLHDAWQDPSAWDAREIVVDGDLVEASHWASPSGEWCAVARTGEHRVHLAVAGTALEDLQVGAVQEWAPYGVDLGQPQFASTIGRLAAKVLPAWEAYDMGT